MRPVRVVVCLRSCQYDWDGDGDGKGTLVASSHTMFVLTGPQITAAVSICTGKVAGPSGQGDDDDDDVE